jgi:hypothetical protein
MPKRKPFEPRWAVICRIGTRWYPSVHRFWLRDEAEEYSKRDRPDDRMVIDCDATDPATIITLLNG